MRAHWKQFLALFFAIAVAITSGVIVTTRFQAAENEHTHNEACYTEKEVSRVLTCTIPEGLDENPIICGQEEDYALSCGYEDGQLIDYHFHNQDCYGEDGNLACGMQEFQDRHLHNDATCYSGHKHSDQLGCFGEKNHKHTDECCYDITTEKVLDCFKVTVKYVDNDGNTVKPDTSFQVKGDGTLKSGTYSTDNLNDYYISGDIKWDDSINSVNYALGGAGEDNNPTTATISSLSIFDGQPISQDTTTITVTYDKRNVGSAPEEVVGEPHNLIVRHQMIVYDGNTSGEVEYAIPTPTAGDDPRPIPIASPFKANDEFTIFGNGRISGTVTSYDEILKHTYLIDGKEYRAHYCEARILPKRLVSQVEFDAEGKFEYVSTNQRREDVTITNEEELSGELVFRDGFYGTVVSNMAKEIVGVNEDLVLDLQWYMEPVEDDGDEDQSESMSLYIYIKSSTDLTPYGFTSVGDGEYISNKPYDIPKGGSVKVTLPNVDDIKWTPNSGTSQAPVPVDNEVELKYDDFKGAYEDYLGRANESDHQYTYRNLIRTQNNIGRDKPMVMYEKPGEKLLVVAIRPDASIHNGDNFTMDNGSQFFNNGNYVHPYWHEKVDLTKYFTSTDAITKQDDADAKIRAVLQGDLESDIQTRLENKQLKPGQELAVAIEEGGPLVPIDFDRNNHRIQFTNLNWEGNILHLDGIIKFNSVKLTYNSNYPNGAENTSFSDPYALVKSEVPVTVKAINDAKLNITVPEGWKFVGWNTQADGKGESIPAGKEISIGADKELFAQWEPEKKVVVKYIDDTTKKPIIPDEDPEKQRGVNEEFKVGDEEYKVIEVKPEDKDGVIEIICVPRVDLVVKYRDYNNREASIAGIDDYVEKGKNVGFVGDPINIEELTDKQFVANGVEYIRMDIEGVGSDFEKNKTVTLGNDGAVVTVYLGVKPEDAKNIKINHWKVTRAGLERIGEQYTEAYEETKAVLSKNEEGYYPFAKPTFEEISEETQKTPWGGKLADLQAEKGWNPEKGYVETEENKGEIEYRVVLKDVGDNSVVNFFYAPYGKGEQNNNNGGTTPPPGNNGGTTPPPGNNGGTTPPPGNNGGTTTPPGNNGGTTTPPNTNNTTTPNQPQNNTPNQPGNVTPVQPGNTTPNAQPQAETPSLINANGQTPVAPAQPADAATLNNIAIPGETPAPAAPEAAVADEASATSSTSYVPAAPAATTNESNIVTFVAEATPTGDVQLTQVDDVEAALADLNFGHVCNILYFLIIAGTIVVLANYFRMSKKHSKRVFELRGELGEDDPYKKN